MGRRAGNGWTASMGTPMAEQAARQVAEQMGWDEARIQAETQAYKDYVARNHLWHGAGD